MSSQIESVDVFDQLTHIQEDVPVNLLLFGTPFGGKMDFSHGYVHAPVNEEQSILIPINPELADHAAGWLPDDCYDINDYYRDRLAKAFVGLETYYASSNETHPFVSLNEVKDLPARIVSPAEVYPELLDNFTMDATAGLDCYMVQCTGNVITPARAEELREVPGINSRLAKKNPSTIIGWVGWNAPEGEETVKVTSGLGDPRRLSDKFFRYRSWTSVLSARADMQEARRAGVEPAKLQDVLAQSLINARNSVAGCAVEPIVPAVSTGSWFWLPILVSPSTQGFLQGVLAGAFGDLVESL
mgnify:FL=1